MGVLRVCPGGSAGHTGSGPATGRMQAAAAGRALGTPEPATPAQCAAEEESHSCVSLCRCSQPCTLTILSPALACPMPLIRARPTYWRNGHPTPSCCSTCVRLPSSSNSCQARGVGCGPSTSPLTSTPIAANQACTHVCSQCRCGVRGRCSLVRESATQCDGCAVSAAD